MEKDLSVAMRRGWLRVQVAGVAAGLGPRSCGKDSQGRGGPPPPREGGRGGHRGRRGPLSDGPQGGREAEQGREVVQARHELRGRRGMAVVRQERVRAQERVRLELETGIVSTTDREQVSGVGVAPLESLWSHSPGGSWARSRVRARGGARGCGAAGWGWWRGSRTPPRPPPPHACPRPCPAR